MLIPPSMSYVYYFLTEKESHSTCNKEAMSNVNKRVQGLVLVLRVFPEDIHTITSTDFMM